MLLLSFFILCANRFRGQLFWNHALFSKTYRYLFIPENNTSPCQIIWRHLHAYFITRENADIVHSHFPRDGGQYFMPVFQLYPEHGIRQGFYDRTILFNKGLFRHMFFGNAKVSVSGVKKKKAGSFLPAGC
jgi:hypothetical protein